MVVLATNTPQVLDEAIQDRIDEMLYFDKPSLTERTNILFQYLIKYCKPKKSFIEKAKDVINHPSLLINGKKTINISQLDSKYIESIAERTEGFSGRELTKLVVSWHDAAFSMENPTLDKVTVEEVLNRHIEQFKTKNKWNKTQKDYFNLMHNKKI
jgi:ATPase family AAA domain-containing protein 3A/B